jgi:hypothetical protein
MRAGKTESNALDGAICSAGSSRTRSFAARTACADMPRFGLAANPGKCGVSSGRAAPVRSGQAGVAKRLFVDDEPLSQEAARRLYGV